MDPPSKRRATEEGFPFKIQETNKKGFNALSAETIQHISLFLTVSSLAALQRCSRLTNRSIAALKKNNFFWQQLFQRQFPDSYGLLSESNPHKLKWSQLFTRKVLQNNTLFANGIAEKYASIKLQGAVVQHRTNQNHLGFLDYKFIYLFDLKKRQPNQSKDKQTLKPQRVNISSQHEAKIDTIAITKRICSLKKTQVYQLSFENDSYFLNFSLTNNKLILICEKGLITLKISSKKKLESSYTSLRLDPSRIWMVNNKIVKRKFPVGATVYTLQPDNSLQKLKIRKNCAFDLEEILGAQDNFIYGYGAQQETYRPFLHNIDLNQEIPLEQPQGVNFIFCSRLQLFQNKLMGLYLQFDKVYRYHLMVWDVSTGKKLYSLNAWNSDDALTPCWKIYQERIFTSDQDNIYAALNAWNLHTGDFLYALPARLAESRQSLNSAVAFDEFLVTGTKIISLGNRELSLPDSKLDIDLASSSNAAVPVKPFYSHPVAYADLIFRQTDFGPQGKLLEVFDLREGP